ncbi:uncharacterized protein OCT59_016728 [Rhizophagus irregularis]|uniref:Uncharacterized protein n=1 Tax=Rhizophagus irregularis TaxID=588596 RepID=A0A916EED6_9GLOM|nr:hypothetical protein OCT59_016728 [Rhizophagus irregularis]CAB5189410.1 unnamed protein product [Rhizophagus irregularis]CAB5381053.1 unnamed protein product [Rhizophagus irregularis]
MQQYNDTIHVVDIYSFESLALIKSFKKNLAKLIYKVQYGDWLKGSDQGYGIKSLRMPAHAIILDKVKLKPSSKAKQAIGKHEEIKLKKSTAVRYLLKPGELEGRITDPYWSLRVYKIKQVVIGKNLPQLVLYYLKNEPIKLTAYLIGRNLKRLFKYEELQVIEESDKIEYLLDNFMWKYHNSKFVYFTQIADKMLIKAQEYAEKRNR